MAFYRREGDALVPTPNCIGPWHPELQHGGPPAALLAGAAERFGEDGSSFVVVRVTVELLRPIGFHPLTIRVTPIRLGRQAQWLQADLMSDGRHLARATVVRIAGSDLTLPQRTRPEPSPPGPEGLPGFVFPFFQAEEGYHHAVELRIAEGAWAEGPCTAWMRPKFPLIEGETSSPLETVMILADATNGIAPALPTDAFTFVNPDLTVHLRRPLEGDWLALAARSVAEPIGTGLVQSRLFDRGGEIGHCLQSLVVRAR
ncbi:MAG: thioesterase family protein [Acidobacteriota bacterium]